MKGLWTSDWIWFKSQKRFLLMMAFLIVCFLFSGQSSFLILYFIRRQEMKRKRFLMNDWTGSR